MTQIGEDSMKTRRTLDVDGKRYDYFSLPAAADAGIGDISRLPFSLKVLLENLLRHEDGISVTLSDIHAMAGWLEKRKIDQEIAYRPARVLMQDFTGVPAIVDLAAMRDAMLALGKDPTKINPLSTADLVIDHSVQVDHFGSQSAFKENVDIEMSRNQERYEFLRWGQTAFENFRVVPPGTGICHQVNLENLAQTVWTSRVGKTTIAYPDTLVGTDSHTTMINGLAVLGWGVGGIEAEAVMLGQPISMLIPEVVGFKLTGELQEGTTATDLVLTVTQMLRSEGVVGKFVEFFGPGLEHLALADRATIANMAPEYGATCGFFPVDQETIAYLKFSGRALDRVKLVEAYAKAQGLWRDSSTPDPVFSGTVELNISTVEPSIAGPRRPQDKILLRKAKHTFEALVTEELDRRKKNADNAMTTDKGQEYEISDGAIVIAAITSCTNTSNPSVMLAAGLLARNAVKFGLKVKPWVKTSLAPGSKVVTDYLRAAGVDRDLDTLGFNLVGYGCTTCIGNSGPLPESIEASIHARNLLVASILSGNRNFEGRVHPLTRANYLASPPLVVAYALAGSMLVDLIKDPIGNDQDGKPIYLRDIWPSNKEIQDTIKKSVTREMFRTQYSRISEGDENWKKIHTPIGQTYAWPQSTYVHRPPYFADIGKTPPPISDIRNARILGLLGDTVTTDHISPAGTIPTDGPAGKYLKNQGVEPKDFNSFGARRGNHEVMVRGTFANIRLRNAIVPGTEGGWTKIMPNGDQVSIYDAAVHYAKTGTPLVIVAGKEYGTGSSRDWAAKGTKLLGIQAVIAETFERIHRSNLVGMGVLPATFRKGTTQTSLDLDGSELIDILGLDDQIRPRMDLICKITRASGVIDEVPLLCRIDTANEVDYFVHGGILHYVLRQLSEAV
ncbi:MAG: Aconitate hydratase A [Alphaproteobacteria bacterium MarineAlpha9_Bin7]|nr:MAG: Aconitate hydratase A [Alphaproteobacteria bacterium MarineAlpha9_Bin7]